MTILLVEDNAGHARLVERCLGRARIAQELLWLRDGQAAIDYLFQASGDGSTQQALPRVILLDLNLPEVDGYQILQRVKTDKRTRHVPVIIMSTSDDPHDIQRCLALGCQAYFTKPVDYIQLVEVLKMYDGSDPAAGLA